MEKSIHAALIACYAANLYDWLSPLVVQPSRLPEQAGRLHHKPLVGHLLASRPDAGVADGGDSAEHSHGSAAATDRHAACDILHPLPRRTVERSRLAAGRGATVRLDRSRVALAAVHQRADGGEALHVPRRRRRRVSGSPSARPTAPAEVRPETIESPGLRVLVDTKPPVLKITARPADGGQVMVHWEIDELHLKPDSLRIVYRPSPAEPWQAVAIDPRSQDHAAAIAKRRSSFSGRSRVRARFRFAWKFPTWPATRPLPMRGEVGRTARAAVRTPTTEAARRLMPESNEAVTVAAKPAIGRKYVPPAGDCPNFRLSENGTVPFGLRRASHRPLSPACRRANGRGWSTRGPSSWNMTSIRSVRRASGGRTLGHPRRRANLAAVYTVEQRQPQPACASTSTTRDSMVSASW